MALRQLDQPQWQAYFDSVSKVMGGQTVEVEVAGLRLGDQIAAEYVPINGLSYDPKADAFVVDTETLDHLIYHPKAIWANDSVQGLHSVQVTDADGNEHIIKLRTPLPLPAP